MRGPRRCLCRRVYPQTITAILLWLALLHRLIILDYIRISFCLFVGCEAMLKRD